MCPLVASRNQLRLRLIRRYFLACAYLPSAVSAGAGGGWGAGAMSTLRLWQRPLSMQGQRCPHYGCNPVCVCVCVWGGGGSWSLLSPLPVSFISYKPSPCLHQLQTVFLSSTSAINRLPVSFINCKPSSRLLHPATNRLPVSYTSYKPSSRLLHQLQTVFPSPTPATNLLPVSYTSYKPSSCLLHQLQTVFPSPTPAINRRPVSIRYRQSSCLLHQRRYYRARRLLGLIPSGVERDENVFGRRSSSWNT